MEVVDVPSRKRGELRLDSIREAKPDKYIHLFLSWSNLYNAR